MERLRRYNVVALQDMEKVIKVLEKRYKDNQLVAQIKKLTETSQLVQSLAQLQEILPSSNFSKILK
jgi:hypothetical protein